MNAAHGHTAMISITCCVEGGFLSAAAGLAARIRGTFGLKGELMKEHNAIYEVAVNGNTVFSSEGDGGRGFPSEDVILPRLAPRVAGETANKELNMSQTNKNTADSDNMPPVQDIKKERRDSTVLTTLSSCGCSPTGEGGKTCACSTRNNGDS